MIKSMQRCQNCRFFKRTWEKVQKRAKVPTYLDYNELDNHEKAEVTLHYNEPHLRPVIEYKDKKTGRSMSKYKEPTITEEGPYVRKRLVSWEEYEPQDRGVCRRYPPQLTETSRHGINQLLPNVDVDHYCGEWRPILASSTISAYPEE